MTLMQAADATKLVRENIESAAETFLNEIAPYVEKASKVAMTFITAEAHPNPEVLAVIKQRLDALGYSLSFSEDKMKISWGK